MIWLQLLLATLSVQAQLESTYLKKLRSAGTHLQVAEAQEEFAAIEQSKRICQIQLHQKTLPTGCYRRLRLEEKWKLISPERSATVRRQIDEACESASVAALSDETEPLEVSGEVSTLCAKAIRKAQEIRDYRSAEIFSKKSKRSNGVDIENSDWL